MQTLQFTIKQGAIKNLVLERVRRSKLWHFGYYIKDDFHEIVPLFDAADFVRFSLKLVRHSILKKHYRYLMLPTQMLDPITPNRIERKDVLKVITKGDWKFNIPAGFESAAEDRQSVIRLLQLEKAYRLGPKYNTTLFNGGAVMVGGGDDPDLTVACNAKTNLIHLDQIRFALPCLARIAWIVLRDCVSLQQDWRCFLPGISAQDGIEVGGENPPVPVLAELQKKKVYAPFIAEMGSKKGYSKGTLDLMQMIWDEITGDD